MPKIFDRDDIKAEERLNENLWFYVQQGFMLWLANREDGRKLLNIDALHLPFDRIDRIYKNHVAQYEYVEDASSPTGWLRKTKWTFVPGAKFANRVRFEWETVKEFYREYVRTLKEDERSAIFAPVALFPGFAFGSTLTVYPDPDAETTSVDGRTRHYSGPLFTFANLRNQAGTNAYPSESPSDCEIDCDAGAVGATKWWLINRNFTLFDTAAISDAETVSAATWSIWAVSLYTDWADSCNVVTSAPASNTNLVAGDFNIANWSGSSKVSDTETAYSAFNSGAYNDFALNATGLAAVSKTGVTKLGWRGKCDVDASEPSTVVGTSAGINARFAEHTGTGSDPKLYVESSVVSTFTPARNVTF